MLASTSRSYITHMIYDVVMYPRDQSMQIHSVLEYDELVLYTRVVYIIYS